MGNLGPRERKKGKRHALRPKRGTAASAVFRIGASGSQLFRERFITPLLPTNLLFILDEACKINFELCDRCQEAAGTPKGAGTPTEEEGVTLGLAASARAHVQRARCVVVPDVWRGRVLSGPPADRRDAAVAQEGAAVVERSEPRTRGAGAEASVGSDPCWL
ncbi:hypothetical protein NDU88_003119 [Pleurodeles waltl]|uniref:Uncharacterized protein n=1 Tax=Pleurodeles waltl TaxID=8319 RepID=A0AAV7LG66_PLEWA|nr:hypothetical protein NDU88_003119 [Pleurodeles waltl]